MSYRPYFPNWRCFSYRISGKTRKDYDWKELRPYFYIDGSAVAYCKRDFGNCKAGKYYLISDGAFYGCGYVIHDQSGFDSWQDCEYMKDGSIIEGDIWSN